MLLNLPLADVIGFPLPGPVFRRLLDVLRRRDPDHPGQLILVLGLLDLVDPHHDLAQIMSVTSLRDHVVPRVRIQSARVVVLHFSVLLKSDANNSGHLSTASMSVKINCSIAA